MQSLSRAAVLLTASALTLGVTAATATADTAPLTAASTVSTPNGGHTGGSKGGPVSGPVAGPGKDSAKDRRIARLTKALDRARTQRADAYAATSAAKATLRDADLIAHGSEVNLLTATENEHAAKADLAEARTRLNHARALIADATDLLAANHDAQDAAATAIAAAEAARDDAATKADDLTIQVLQKTASRDATRDSVTLGENTLQWLTDTAIPQATTNLEAAQADVDALTPQVQAAFDLYTERTWAYFECRPQPDGQVDCLDFSYNWGIRGEVTHPWGIYLDLLDQQTQAQATADSRANTLTYYQSELATGTTNQVLRVASATAAQEALDTAIADLDAAEAAQVTAAATIVEQTDLLDTLAAEDDTLTENLTKVTDDEKPVAAVEAKRAAALAAVTAALNDTKAVHATNLTSEKRAQQALTDAYSTLSQAQDVARHVKDRLQKARQHNR
jgi:hypothetical protein